MCLVEESLTTVRPYCSTLKVFSPGERLERQIPSIAGDTAVVKRKEAILCVHGSSRRARQSVYPGKQAGFRGPQAGRLCTKNRLTKTNRQRTLRSRFYNPSDCVNRLSSAMSKVCSITGSRVTRGSTIHRRGMAKKKGGVGRHVTKNVRREFHPNLHEHRIWVPELKKFVRIRVTARGLKTINKNGAYRALKKAGVVAG
jgi:large subunit ribosomal protein L28